MTTLPVTEAGFDWVNQLFDAPMHPTHEPVKATKYSDAEQRDERGRWTVGGEGGNEGADTSEGYYYAGRTYHRDPSVIKVPSGWTTTEAALTDLRARYPKTTFDDNLAALDPGRIMPALAGLDMMMTRFPTVAMARVAGDRATGKDGPNALAQTGYNMALNGSEITFNPKFFGTGKKDLWATEQRGWWVDGVYNPQGTAIHEFGHAFMNQVADNHADPSSPEGIKPDAEMMRVSDMWNSVAMGHELSGYAESAGGYEAFAEAFSAAFDPDSQKKDATFAKEVVTFAKVEFPSK